MFQVLLFLYWFCLTFNELAKGKTVITHPSVIPVYLKAGDDLDLLCQQFSGFKISWSRKTFNTRHYEVLKNSFNTDFLELSHVGGVYHLRLTKKNVQVADSGSYKCSVLSGRDLPYAVDVFVLQIQNSTEAIVQAGNHTNLRCSMFDSTFKPSVIWYKDDLEIARTVSPFHIGPPSFPATIATFAYPKFILNTSHAEESTDSILMVRNIGEHDVGEYVCQFLVNDEHSFNQTVFLYSYPQIKSMGRSYNTVEGKRMELECKVWGWPLPTVAWARSTDPDEFPTPLEQTGRVAFINNNHTLVLHKAHVKDRAYYTCIATSQVNASLKFSTSATILVRVRGKFAPLVPLVGVVVEFVVLCLIIYVYEKKKKAERANKEALELKENAAASNQAASEKQSISASVSRDTSRKRKPQR